MAKHPRDPDTIKAFVTVEDPEPFSPPWPDECPAAGFHADEPYETYRAWPAANSTALKEGYQVTAKRMRAALDGLIGGDSKPRKFGRAVHARLLEPEAYKTRFLLAGDCEAILKSGPRKAEPCGKAAGFYDGEAWYCGMHQKAYPGAVEPEEYVSQQEAENIERIVVAVKSHEAVRLLRQRGGCELSFVWERDGFACKGRGDKIILDVPKCNDTIIDIKKMQSGKGDTHSLQTSIRTYAWDMQAAFYCSGVEALTGRRPDFRWVFVEDNIPFDVCVVPLTKAMREVGRCKVNTAFETYKRGVEYNQWPGYGDDYVDVEPADWERKRYGA